MIRLSVSVAFLVAAVAFAEDETYRDPASKETLFIAGGPNVSYASLKRSSLRPLKIVAHDDGKRTIDVKFDKSPTVWTLTIDEGRTRVVCEAEGQPRQVFERIKVDPKGLPGTTAGPDQTVSLTSPENEASIYDEVTNFQGRVSADCVRVEAISLDASGEIQKREVIKGYVPGAPAFTWEVSKKRKNMSLGSNRFRFVATFKDGGVALTEVRVSFHEYEGEMAKPVIYLYPTTKDQRVHVEVRPAGGVTKSAPPYVNGWDVTASPEGVLRTADGARHPYLFWESGLIEKPQPLTEGFVVKRGELKQFLNEKLTFLGLNARERADFLEYWLPLMSVKPYAAVRFVPREEIDAAAPLLVSPTPAVTIRVLTDFRALEQPVKLKEQVLVAPSARAGFVAVEWGGLRY